MNSSARGRRYESFEVELRDEYRAMGNTVATCREERSEYTAPDDERSLAKRRPGREVPDWRLVECALCSRRSDCVSRVIAGQEFSLSICERALPPSIMGRKQEVIIAYLADGPRRWHTYGELLHHFQRISSEEITLHSIHSAANRLIKRGILKTKTLYLGSKGRKRAVRAIKIAARV